MKTTVLTTEQAVQRRDTALATLGMTPTDYRALKDDYDCSCCLDEDVRRMKVYPYTGDLGAMRAAAHNEVRNMDYLLDDYGRHERKERP